MLCAATPRKPHSLCVPSTGLPLGVPIGRGGGWRVTIVWVRCFLPIVWPVGMSISPIPEHMVLGGPIFAVPLPSLCHLMARGGYVVLI